MNFYSYYGGELLDTQVIRAGDTAVNKDSYYVLGNSYEYGYFDGWRYQIDNTEGISNIFSFSLPIYENIDVYASWDPGYYKVTYDLAGGTGTTPVDSDLYAPGTAARVASGDGIYGSGGQAFTGWNTQADGSGTAYNALDIMDITGDLTLYAQWDEGYTVTYDANGGTGSYDDSELALDSTYTVKSDTATGISRDGYTFKGWNTQEDGSGTPYASGDTFQITENVTLYAQWEDGYTVSYDANGDIGSYDDSGLAYGSTYTVKSDSTTDISRDGYSFKGWNTQADGNGTPYAAGDTFQITENVTLYAQWEEGYTVSYDANGGTGSYADSGLAYGTSYTVKSLTTTGISHDGCTFIGWNTQADGNGTAYEAGQTFNITENVTLYAQWEENEVPPPQETYTVTYNANEGTGSHSDTGLTAGSAYTVKSGTETGISRDGYTLTGWNTQADGNGTDYEAGQSFEVSGNLTLYAQWEKNTPPKTYTVTYNANEGSGSYINTGLTAGSEYTVKSDTVTGISRDGYIFDGWNTRADGSGTAYKAGDTFEITEDVTLYAQWDRLINDEDHIKYLYGYPDGGVRPGDNIARAEAAAIFYRLLKNKATTTRSFFSDVSSDAWYAPDVNYLSSLGIISGYKDGTFRPYDYITRDEFATLAAHFDELAESTTNIFPDVGEDHWAKGYINLAYVKGWVSGDPDGTFRPNDHITRAEVLSVVNLMLNREIGEESLAAVENPYNDITPSHWAYPDVIEATYEHEFERLLDNTEKWTSWVLYP